MKPECVLPSRPVLRPPAPPLLIPLPHAGRVGLKARVLVGLGTPLIQLLVLTLWPLAIVLALQAAFAFATGPSGALLAASLFFLATMAPTLVRGTPTYSSLFRVLAHVVAGALVLSMICALAGWPTFGLGVVIVVYVAALQEELVFRVALPRWMGAAQTRAGIGAPFSRIAAGGISQVSFALAHWPSGHLDALRAIALVTIGLFLLTLRSAAGVGSAAALHAFLNLTAMESYLGYHGAPLPEALALLFIAIFVYSAGEIAKCRTPHVASGSARPNTAWRIGHAADHQRSHDRE